MEATLDVRPDYFNRTLVILGLGFGALGWLIIALLLWWQVQQPSPIVLEGCTEAKRSTVASPPRKPSPPAVTRKPVPPAPTPVTTVPPIQADATTRKP